MNQDSQNPNHSNDEKASKHHEERGPVKNREEKISSENPASRDSGSPRAPTDSEQHQVRRRTTHTSPTGSAPNASEGGKVFKGDGVTSTARPERPPRENSGRPPIRTERSEQAPGQRQDRPNYQPTGEARPWTPRPPRDDRVAPSPGRRPTSPGIDNKENASREGVGRETQNAGREGMSREGIGREAQNIGREAPRGGPSRFSERREGGGGGGRPFAEREGGSSSGGRTFTEREGSGSGGGRSFAERQDNRSERQDNRYSSGESRYSRNDPKKEPQFSPEARARMAKRLNQETQAENQAAAKSKIDAQGRAWAVGRRKTSTAKIIVWREGSIETKHKGMSVTSSTVKKVMSIEEYFKNNYALLALIKAPLELIGFSCNFLAKVGGGGLSGQAGAIRLGLSRALVSLMPDLHAEFRKLGFLTRDSRMVERKKYGQHKARKKTQFSKR